VVHVVPDQFADLPKLILSEGTALVYYDTADLIDSTCETLLQRTHLDSSHPLIVGFDVEYEVEFDGQSGVGSRIGSNSCDVVQIALSDVVYVFKVCFDLTYTYIRESNIISYFRSLCFSHMLQHLPIF
jgi:hypothetical protein